MLSYVSTPYKSHVRGTSISKETYEASPLMHIRQLGSSKACCSEITLITVISSPEVSISPHQLSR